MDSNPWSKMASGIARVVSVIPGNKPGFLKNVAESPIKTKDGRRLNKNCSTKIIIYNCCKID
jgi:hypothetical protein